MANEIGTGIFGGATTGASTGFTVGGPVGAGIGAGLGAILGGFQGSRAKKLNKAYEAAERNVNPIDPMQTAHLARLRQQERQMRAGTDASSQFASQQARNIAGQTQANLQRAGGPGLVGNLLRSQQALGNTVAGIGAQAASGANQLLGMQGDFVNRISERVYQRQRELRNQALERSTAARQDLNNMLSGGLAMLPNIAGSFGKAGGKSFDPFGSTSSASFLSGPAFGPEQEMTRLSPRLPQANPLSYQPRY